LTSCENFLNLVSHKKLHFSRETRTRRDEISLMVTIKSPGSGWEVSCTGAVCATDVPLHILKNTLYFYADCKSGRCLQTRDGWVRPKFLSIQMIEIVALHQKVKKFCFFDVKPKSNFTKNKILCQSAFCCNYIYPLLKHTQLLKCLTVICYKYFLFFLKHHLWINNTHYFNSNYSILLLYK
jgi:hypothetical protein